MDTVSTFIHLPIMFLSTYIIREQRIYHGPILYNIHNRG